MRTSMTKFDTIKIHKSNFVGYSVHITELLISLQLIHILKRNPFIILLILNNFRELL